MLASGALVARSVGWELSKPEETRWVEFGEEAMLFNPVSWETHRVSGIVVFVVEAVLAGARSLSDIVQAMPPTDLSRGALAHGVQRALEELQGLGIVRASHAE